MKYLREIQQEISSSSINETFKPNDIISYYVPDMMVPNNLYNEYHNDELSIEELVKKTIAEYKLLSTRDLKKIKIENPSISPNGNLEFTLIGKYNMFKAFIKDLKDSGFDDEEILSAMSLKESAKTDRVIDNHFKTWKTGKKFDIDFKGVQFVGDWDKGKIYQDGEEIGYWFEDPDSYELTWDDYRTKEGQQQTTFPWMLKMFTEGI